MAALGDEEEWDQEVGLKAEIIPLTRPFGIYAGNVFQGVVKFKGKPVPDADVEVEYWNPGKKVTAPNEYFVTLKVKTDKNGVFTFAPPKAGWWGFSALNEEKEAIRGQTARKRKPNTARCSGCSLPIGRRQNKQEDQPCGRKTNTSMSTPMRK